MAVRVNITVFDITSTLSAGYTHIKVYRSSDETTGFAEITTPSSIILLVAGTSTYYFDDVGGTTNHWYKTTFYNNSTADESAFSTAFQGDYVDLVFSSANRYPEEGIFTNRDRLIIDRIRDLIGDRKELTRDYVSVLTGYDNVSEDQYSFTLSNPNGWPVQVNLDGTYYTTKSNPAVNGYQFITFSGTQISTTSGTLDVWYYHFRYSDSEILTAYNGQSPPYPLLADEVTFELSLLCAAVDLMESEVGGASAASGVEVDIFEEIRINPKVGLDSRTSTLQLLLKRKQDLVDKLSADAISSDIYGVLID